jgi:DNA (cytosine-5)-methyltransferase 1
MRIHLEPATALVVQEAGNLFETATAVFDPTCTYRYLLTRTWGPGPGVLFVMLNPSTADADHDDPTLRRADAYGRRCRDGEPAGRPASPARPRLPGSDQVPPTPTPALPAQDRHVARVRRGHHQEGEPLMLTLYDEFAGFGGSSQGAATVPGVELMLAANHNPLAIDVHSMNFPKADHYCGDIAKADIAGFPRADLFWSSPSCPPWTDARGVKRDFDRSTQGVLFDFTRGPVATDPAVARARALMEEVPRYLQAMRRKGKPVLAGVVENVVQVRKWDEFRRWRREIEAEGYRTRLVALNSMHITAPVTGRVAQSRDRFYMPFWLADLGRDPDWDKWLRPKAYCGSCDRMVDAMQVFKREDADMGRYGIRHGQYVYRCPATSCRHQVAEPGVLPATTVIDWALPPGQRIGERVDSKGRPDPLADATLARIKAGLLKHARPLLAPTGGTWRETATSVDEPMPTRTCRETDGLVVPSLVVPVAKRAGVDTATTVEQPLRTQTCRRETAVVIPPFISLLRGGGSKTAAYPVAGPLPTVSAQCNHHGLVEPGPEVTAMLLAYYSNGAARPVDEPIGTLTTRDRYAVVGPPTDVEHMLVRQNTARGNPGQMCTSIDEPARTITTAGHQSLVGWHTGRAVVEQCTFRMLAPREIAAGMGFAPDYKVKGSNRDQVRGYGNAVTPPAAEVLISALVEAISGEPFEAA